MYCQKKKNDYVILLHGDGQYAPEFLPKMIAGFIDEPDAVFASRMLDKKRALSGGMPLYKWIGNQVLTCIENILLNLNLSEFHTGFRAYKVDALSKIPFQYNSNDFHYDTEIIIQAKAANWKIVEFSLPAYYGNEKCHVDGLKYAYNCIKAVARFHLVNLGLYYKRNYDLGIFEHEKFELKQSPYSMHQHLLSETDSFENKTSIEIGTNKGLLSKHIARRMQKHYAADSRIPEFADNCEKIIIDFNNQFSDCFKNIHFDICICLDKIEHIEKPEEFIQEIFKIMNTNGVLYLGSANIGYFPVRLSLLFGQFNYGKRGILDMTHKRLFTLKSIKNLTEQYGFKIEKVLSFPPPLTDMIKNNWLFYTLEKIHYFLAKLFPNFFAYNFLLICKRIDGLDEIFNKTIK